MRVLWTMVKVIVGLAIGIPLCIVVLATALGVLGALLGLAVLALKVAFVGFVAWMLFRIVAGLLRGSAPAPGRPTVAELPHRDRYHEAAMRELDEALRR